MFALRAVVLRDPDTGLTGSALPDDHFHVVTATFHN